MKNIKTAFIIIAVVLAAVVALSLVGMILTALQYIFWLGIIGLAGAAAVKLLWKKPNSPQLVGKTAHVDELEDADRTLE